MGKRNNNQVVKINESQLKSLIKDSMKKILKEDFSSERPENKFNATKPSYWKDNHGYDDEKANKASDWMSRHYGDLEEDYDDLYDYGENGEEQDDWRSEEPSQNDVISILQQIQEKCNECGAVFKNLGENEFGVISKNGNCPKVENLLQMFESNGVIYNTGGRVSTNGPWNAKFRVIKALNESTGRGTNAKKAKNRIKINKFSLKGIIMESVKRVINEIGDTPKGQYMLGRLDAKYIKKMHDAEDEEERIKMWQKANDINDYASKQISPEKYDGIDDDEETYSLPTAYRLGYKDELGGTTGIDKMFSITGHKNNLNNTEKDAKFRKRYLDGVSIA